MPRIPEPPSTPDHLDLLVRLDHYRNGHCTWREDESAPDPKEQKACDHLYNNLLHFHALVRHILNRCTAREMDVFTLHDEHHGTKVAHLCWHVLTDDRRSRLTPPEIALIFASSYFHDLGMALSQADRAARLSRDSDLWLKYDFSEQLRPILDQLEALRSKTSDLTARAEIDFQLAQAYEALLCLDTRERHALPERYHDLLNTFREWHSQDPESIHSVDTLLTYNGDSIRDPLVEICVSHAQPPHKLIEPTRRDISRPRFPTDLPVGNTTANTLLAASCLRIADILDFDRERTPAPLYHFLLPRNGDPNSNVSLSEWNKHMSISHFELLGGEVVYRGRCRQPQTHHAIALFVDQIAYELQSTRSTFGNEVASMLRPTGAAPAARAARADIEPEGYRYLPYRFALDEDRIYGLLMGRQLYSHGLVALRELIQNSVDACRFRDALQKSQDSASTPTYEKRISVVLGQHANSPPTLTVSDTGTGMDQHTIESYLLKVGRSFYTSPAFLRHRAALVQNGLDFAPTSEFGIGILSCFMLGDTITVRTEPWLGLYQDAARRTLEIDGLTRLIEVYEEIPDPEHRRPGPEITIRLNAAYEHERQWSVIKDYITGICLDFPYTIHLEFRDDSEIHATHTHEPPGVTFPPSQIDDGDEVVNVHDSDEGLEGTILLTQEAPARQAVREQAASRPLTVDLDSAYDRPAPYLPRGRHSDSHPSELMRGGFLISEVPGLPEYGTLPAAAARIRLSSTDDRGFSRLPQTNIVRSATNNVDRLQSRIVRHWFEALIQRHRSGRPPVGRLTLSAAIHDQRWQLSHDTWHFLEEYEAAELVRFALSYRTCRATEEGKQRSYAWYHGTGTAALPLSDFGRFMDEYLICTGGADVLEFAVNAQGDYFLLPPASCLPDLVPSRLTWSNERPPALFATYPREHSHLLYFDWPSLRSLNSRFRDDLSGFGPDSILALLSTLDKYQDAVQRSRRSSISPAESAVLSSAADRIGSVQVEVSAKHKIRPCKMSLAQIAEHSGVT